ncbi:MAG: FAD:protein FMN transferase, partial [Clostridiales bacterium]|nr:FAD:protein FMN transferase [Clostridiales bacterium]
FLFGCSNSKPYSKSDFLLDTIVTVTLYDNNPELFESIFSIIRDYENVLNTHHKDTEIYMLNQSAYNHPFQMSDTVYEIITKSIEYSKLSDGYFDISIEPLVALWDINNSYDTPIIPNNSDILNTKNLVNYKNIIIDKHKLSFVKEGMSIDLGGIAKGYIADCVVKQFKEKGIKSAILNLGGNVYVHGTKPDGSLFKIGIQDPDKDRGEILGTIALHDTSIVTSGIYERFFELDGEIYHHIINPFTGYPENNNLKSVTIISKSSLDGDALSTSLFLLGLEKGLDLAESLNNIDAIFVDKSNNVYTTSGIESTFELTNKLYKMKR